MFLRMSVIKHMTVTIDFHREKKKKSQCYRQLSSCQHSLKCIFFVFNLRIKFIQVWNNMSVTKLHYFHFWVNYPFTNLKC